MNIDFVMYTLCMLRNIEAMLFFIRFSNEVYYLWDVFYVNLYTKSGGIFVEIFWQIIIILLN